jgi:hypothetical protein
MIFVPEASPRIRVVRFGFRNVLAGYPRPILKPKVPRHPECLAAIAIVIAIVKAMPVIIAVVGTISILGHGQAAERHGYCYHEGCYGDSP